MKCLCKSDFSLHFFVLKIKLICYIFCFNFCFLSYAVKMEENLSYFNGCYVFCNFFDAK